MNKMQTLCAQLKEVERDLEGTRRAGNVKEVAIIVSRRHQILNEIKNLKTE